MFDYKYKKDGHIATVEATDIQFGENGMYIEWTGTNGFGTVSVFNDLQVDDECMSKEFCMEVIKDAFNNLIKWN